MRLCVFLIRWSDWECTQQATVKRSHGSLSQGGRQMEGNWNPCWDSKGNASRLCWEVPTWPPQVSPGDAGDLVRANPPSCLLGHHHWGCWVSGWESTWEGTERQVYSIVFSSTFSVSNASHAPAATLLLSDDVTILLYIVIIVYMDQLPLENWNQKMGLKRDLHVNWSKAIDNDCWCVHQPNS